MDMLRTEVSVEEQQRYLRRGDYARVTAADRPGVAQPVPVREIPPQPWGRIALGALVLFAVLLGGWESYWRAFGVTPATRNSDGLWAIQRRRIDNGEGDATVAVGASRMYFDLQLDVWEKLDGKRPIQLAFEGTSPVPFLEDLAADPKFTGRLLIGVAPELFFSGYAYRGAALPYYRKESPSQRIGQWLSMRVIEPFFAFYDPDFALATVLKRQNWPQRPGKPAHLDVRKLSISAADRDTHLWEKVESDPDYKALARKIWLQDFQPSDDDPPPEKLKQLVAEQIDRAVAAVITLRARGVKVLFVRPPSTGPYLDFDNMLFPRAATWDVLLARSGAQGIHFEDYTELQGLELPEWSHLKHADAQRFTAALYNIITRDFWSKEEGPSTSR
jgi:hypothetical protein